MNRKFHPCKEWDIRSLVKFGILTDTNGKHCKVGMRERVVAKWTTHRPAKAVAALFSSLLKDELYN